MTSNNIGKAPIHRGSERIRMGVIFDLDGVLVDTGWAHRQAWYDLADKEGFQMTDEFFYSTFGMQNYQILSMLLGPQLPAQEIERMSQWKEKRYRELIGEKLTLPAGVKELLDELKNRGFLLAIGSSAPRDNLELIFRRLNLRHYFDAHITKEEVSKGKPSPETFLKAAEKLSLPPSRCVVVEDAVQGVEAARAAGMSVIAVTTTRARTDLKSADLIVDSLSELRAEDFLRLLAQAAGLIEGE